MVDDSHRELSSRRHERGEESPGPAASELSATAVASGIRDGEFSAEDVTRSCLDRIGTRESDVGAWVNLDPDHALDQARAADERQRAGTRLDASADSIKRTPRPMVLHKTPAARTSRTPRERAVSLICIVCVTASMHAPSPPTEGPG